MEKERPLWQRIYFDPVYTAVAREIGYQGCLYRDLVQKIEALSQRFDKMKVESAIYHLVTFEGQMTCNPKPLAQVAFREDVRKLMWQLLGPPPEKQAEFYRHPDGTPWVPEWKKNTIKPTTVKKPRRKKAAQAAPAEDAPPATPTPIMQRYREAKARHPGMLLLFRMGDFYELFDEDAETAAKVLGLTLATREKTTTMAGFPHHSLGKALRTLLHAGHRVAICDQVEPQSVDRREVTRVVTPGTVAAEDSAKPSPD